MAKMDSTFLNMKKKITQLDRRVRHLEDELAALKAGLGPDKKERLLKQLDRIEEEIEEEVSLQAAEREKEAEKWRKDEERFMGVQEEEGDAEEDGDEGPEKDEHEQTEEQKE